MLHSLHTAVLPLGSILTYATNYTVLRVRTEFRLCNVSRSMQIVCNLATFYTGETRYYIREHTGTLANAQFGFILSSTGSVSDSGISIVL